MRKSSSPAWKPGAVNQRRHNSSEPGIPPGSFLLPTPLSAIWRILQLPFYAQPRAGKVNSNDYALAG